MKEIVNYKSQLLTLSILSTALPAVLLFFSGIVVFLHTSGQMAASQKETEVFQYMVPVVLIVCLTAGHLAFKKNMLKISGALSLQERMLKYQTAFIVRMAIIEAPGVLGAAAALLTGNFYFLLAPALVVVVLLLLRPSAFSIAEDLSLSPQEKTLLEK